LNIYGFQRITNGIDKNCYYHEHFRRGCEHLLDRIQRVPVKKDVKFRSLSDPTMTDVYSSSHDVRDRRNSASMVDSMVSQPTTEIAVSNTTVVGNHNTLSVGDSVTALLNTNQTLPEGFSNVDISSIEHRSIHPFLNPLSAGLSNADSSAIVHRRDHPFANPFIRSHDNFINLEDINHRWSIDRSNAPSSIEELALLLQSVRSSTDAVLSYSQVLQNISPQVSADLLQLMTNQEPLTLSRRILLDAQTQDIFSRLQSEQHHQAQLQSLFNSVALSDALQLQQQNAESSFDPLGLLLSSGGTVQESHGEIRNQMHHHEDVLQSLLSCSNEPQPQNRHESMFQSLQNAVTDGVHTTPLIADNNNIENSGDDHGSQIFDQGENNGDNIGVIAQQEDSLVPSSSTNDLLTMANNVLERYRSNS
jgi:hypothetical protein